ncbi:BTAD domain-containing putative transcriptional regulator [Streptomyces sp. NPDC001339]|uniref:BTAD domain-containing putative transcriptional regulator n=1 Tax=Streptomyces sp. NPDC001339 TaxID=3364563 RepID=UPI0036CAE700
MTHHSALRERLTAALTVLCTLTLTLALLAGMPYLLWQATGVPWPDHISSWHELGERLAEPLSDPLVLDLLAVVGWVCWAAFAYTVLREVCWYTAHLPQLLHDRRAHNDHVAAVSVKSSLAALCIGTLVIALLSLWRPSTATAQQVSPADAARAPVAVTAPLTPSAQKAMATAVASHPGRPGQDASAAAVGHIEYTVQEGDTLWDIAHTYLGDALKWPRIYALNKDRVQRDGDQLTDPDRLRPGWQLTIPAAHQPPAPPPSADRASPAASQTAPPSPSASAMPARPAPDRKPAAGQHLDRAHSLSQPDREFDATVGRTDRESGPAAIGFGEAGLIGITGAAGLLAARRYWYVHQRRLRRPDDEAPALSPLVDKAAQAAHAATQPRRPHDPEALVTRRHPPQQPRSADTVTIGVDDNTEVPLDILATTGGCTWTGPGAEDAARALLTGILTAAERQRPGPPRVSAVVPAELAARLLPGLPAEFTALTQTTDTAHAVQVAEHHLIAHARAQHERDTPTTPPEAADPADEAAPGTLLLLATAERAYLGQLQAMAARSRPGILAVLTLDTPLPDAEHWHIATDGTTNRPSTHPQQHPGLKLFHLTPDASREVTQVLLGAHGQRPNLRILPTQSTPPHDKQPDAAATSEPEPEEEADPSGPHPTSTFRPAQAKPVRLHVLGPITLFARGHAEPIGTNLRPEVHEFLALLAAHPTGLLATDIADKLHLEPDNVQGTLKNLRRAVRRALRAATGITAQEFILRQGELHKLHPELVETDLVDFTCALKHALSGNGVHDSENDAVSAVREALSHYRGPFAQSGDYLWADALREHFTTQATDAALRLAHQAERAAADPQQRDAILPLLEHLGSIHPDHERLAQHTIRLYQAAGRHDAARHAYARLERHLGELGLEPDPATRALLASRAPHPQRTRSR